MDIIEYRSGLATWELIVEVHQLLAAERRAERLVCRYLADLADRVQQRQDLALARYADELHAARAYFGLGARDARERIRVGRALRQLPAIERAFVEGELSYSRVREVTRIAMAANESQWLGLARRLDMRALERRVAAARGREDRNGDPSSFETKPKTRRVTFELSEQAYELLQDALESARSANGECSDAEALERLAHQALSARARATESATTESASPDIAQRDDTTLSSTVPSGSAPASTEPFHAEQKSIKPWSWDELGWAADNDVIGRAATQRASCDNDESRGADARGSGATQRGSSEADKECADADAIGWAATQRASCDNDESRGADARGSGATQRGALEGDGERADADAIGWVATQRGSSSIDDEGRDGDGFEVKRQEVERQEVERQEMCERERLSEINSRLLRAMGGHGRWIADTLIEASGLSASEVNSGLTLLQLSGRIRRRADAFEPI